MAGGMRNTLKIKFYELYHLGPIIFHFWSSLLICKLSLAWKVIILSKCFENDETLCKVENSIYNPMQSAHSSSPLKNGSKSHFFLGESEKMKLESVRQRNKPLGIFECLKFRIPCCRGLQTPLDSPSWFIDPSCITALLQSLISYCNHSLEPCFPSDPTRTVFVKGKTHLRSWLLQSLPEGWRT